MEKIKGMYLKVQGKVSNILVLMLLIIMVLGLISAMFSVASGVVYTIYCWGSIGLAFSKALWEGTQVFLWMLVGGLGSSFITFLIGFIFGINPLTKIKGK